MLGLPAWGLLLSHWTPENPLRIGQLLEFLGLLVLGLVIFTVNEIYPFPSLGLFLLPAIPLVKLAIPECRARPVQTAVELVLGVVTVMVAFAMPTPEGSWSSPWIDAGGSATAGLMIAYWWSRRIPRRAWGPQLKDGAIL